ncbi:flagellar motor stator protein MotA [Virgibacillus dakarensis]|uniref:Motility protein A n=1 Tax=Lentibacillus populi TaxID=1827502 RepID=A0A9W5X4W4_9BACI|nr:MULTISPECIES: flagellar motor stator protein MotA [Bacillaceae]MBT2218421.1 flagellar motor stator protein MotA [Virgibacillus dakarensis]MTW87486.1 flagellar motor stator protein MotA [Virgibacillus dakarensis]GGB35750.1 motility protein A [Lentibacillus populi]
MDKTSIIGVILGIIAIGTGMVLKGVSPIALLNPAALLIIFLGTAASVCVAFPMSTIKKVPSYFKILFKEADRTDMKEVIEMFSNWADLTRREGILSLEKQMDSVKDPFLLSGLQFIVDGKSPDFIREVMLEKISAMEERHQRGITVFSQAGTYAPTLGVLGAVIGLIAALSNLNDIEALGHAISAAFIATLFGIFSGYVLWHPFANKLKEKSKDEAEVKLIMIEGILAITNGESKQVVNDKLGSYLSQKELAKIDLEEADAAEETE